jgi:hypothetical protein
VTSCASRILYLLCATSGSSVSKIIEKMLEASITLSDESIFGQAFFESISSIEREEMAVPGGKSNVAYKAITLINVVHYIPIQSWIEFDDEWAKALNRLHYDFYNNFSKDDGNIDWEKLLRYNSGEDNVPWVSKVIPITTEDQEDESNDDEWAKALNRLHYDFYINFSKDDGSIDWENLLRYNSGKENVPWVSKVIPVITEDQEDESNEAENGDVDYGNEDYA